METIFISKVTETILERIEILNFHACLCEIP